MVRLFDHQLLAVQSQATKSITVVSRRDALRRMLLGAASAGAWFTVQARSEAALTVFFYSPETNVNNFSVLKGEFDSFLAPLGGHKFQPFSDRETFETQFAAQPRGLFLVSSWHYKRLAAETALDPLLIGRTHGRSTQKHQLFGQTQNLEELRSQKIATAGTRDFALTLLGEMLPGQEELIGTLSLLVVPKDIDALMAVGFGAARGAIATESGSDKLAKLNPKQRESLKQIGKGRESLLPVLAARRNADSDVRALATVFSKMEETPEGKSRLQLLGLEAMRPLAAEESGRLTR
jgi:hypothetical protein